MAASMSAARFSLFLQKTAINSCRTCGKSLQTQLNSPKRFYQTSRLFKIRSKSLGVVSAGVISSVALAFINKQFDIWNLPVVGAAKIVEDSQAVSARYKHNFIADVVEKTAPAVVHIEVQGSHPFGRKQTTVSNGSGFIIREDGIILTNAHVVANKAQVAIKLHDGRTFQGTVQAVDPVSDLATVKIQATGLPVIKLGKSSDVRPGEFVVALGSPFQLNNTVTSGIVSSTQRASKDLGLLNRDIDYIQTDAVINFGNSGGPLVNLDGEAIGINTMKVTTGISFAIPSDYAEDFLEKARSIEKRGSSRSWFGPSHNPKRRYMGVTMLTLSPAIINELRTRHDKNFPNVSSGVLIHIVADGSPAYYGGLRPGDVITHINDSAINSTKDIFKIVETESELRITVRRRSDSLNLTIITEEIHDKDN